MIIVIGSITASEDTIDRALELGLAHVHRSRQEPGCILHSVHRDAEDPLRLVFVEQWEDADSLRAHFNVMASGEFVTEATGLATSSPELQIFEAQPASI